MHEGSIKKNYVHEESVFLENLPKDLVLCHTLASKKTVKPFQRGITMLLGNHVYFTVPKSKKTTQGYQDHQKNG